MIDWWPWWVTIAVALPIAAAAFAFALFAKRRDVQGALGLVGVVAIGLSVASPFVMGGDEGTHAMSDERLTSQEFARRADQNCRHLAQEPAANFGNPAPTPDFAAKLDAFLPKLRKALRAQAQLRPPPAEKPAVVRWMHAMAAVGQDFEAMRAAARRSEASAFQAAAKRLSAHAGASARLSKKLGEKFCFQG